MLRRIGADFRRKREIFEEDGATVSVLRMWLTDGASAMVLYRLTQSIASLPLVRPLALLVQWVNRLINGCVIGVDSDFGPGFVIMHPVGIVINSKVRGGRNVTLESGVVIGDEKGQSPRLGDNIFVGAGAKIIGGLTVGDQVKIGANAVVVRSAPAGATMLGIPAKPYGTAEPSAPEEG